MHGTNHPERIKLNHQIKEWNANRLDLFQISEPNEYLEFYGVMRFFFQGDDLKYQTKCLRVSSTATTVDVIEALIIKFHPDLKMLNNDKYQLHENHNLEDRRMKSSEHPLLVQLNWALDDKDGKFILKNESRRRRSIDMTNHNSLFNSGMSRSTSALTNGFESQPLRTHSSSVYSSSSNFMKRFASIKKSKRKSKAEQDANQNLEDAKRLAEEISGKPPESSFTRTISNPDEIMKRRRQQKLESRLEQFSGLKGDGETGGTLKIYGDSINPEIPYKTLLLSVNDTAEKVLAETLDKYGLSSEDYRFFVLVQQNIPPRDDRNRGNIEEIILHDQDCPLGILVHCPPKRGSATFAVRRTTPQDKYPAAPRFSAFSLSAKSAISTPTSQNKDNSRSRRSSVPTSPKRPSPNINDCPRLRHVFVDTDGSLYDVDNGIYSLSSLVNVPLDESLPSEGSKFVKIGSQSSTVGDYPNILLLLEDYPDIRPIHCHISAKLDSQSNSMRLQLTPTLDTTCRTPRPCVTFINQQRIDTCTRLNDGDIIQLGESVMFSFEEFEDETRSDDGYEPESFNEQSDAMQISYLTADLPVTVKYNYGKGPILVDNIMQLSRDYAQRSSKDLFGTNMKLDINNLDETFRLAPAYALYLVLRATLADEQQLVQLTNRVSDQLIRIIKDDSNSVEKEIFWLSNTSELLHLLQYDNDLRHYSTSAQDVLASAIERAFSIVQHEFTQDLTILLPYVLEEDDFDINDNILEDKIPCLDRASVLIQHGGIDYPIQHLLQTLSLAYTLFHNCQVNVALTIQMFSQLFHLLNTWLFNSVLGDQDTATDTYNSYPLPVNQEWGVRLTRRLSRIRNWSEINGLEMAANCHLQKMYQVAELMETDKRDLNVFAEKCIEMVNLNGAQLHNLLISCQDEELPEAWIDVVVNTAIQLHDQEFNDNSKPKSFPKNKNTLPLFEDMDLRLPLLLPADGYCCDRGIVSCPKDLRTLLKSVKDLLTHRLNPPVIDQVDTRWKSYLGTSENTPTVSRSNTILDKPNNPMKSDAPFLPRNWINNEPASVSESVSAPRERYQKKTTNGLQLSLYANPQRRFSVPNTEKDITDQSESGDGSRNSNPLKTDSRNRFELKLTKINNSLGLSIIALKGMGTDMNRIYVKDIITDGAGFNSGMIAVGDQLVSIDGNPLENLTQDEAVSLMKKTKSSVVLLVERGAAQKHGVMTKINQARSNKTGSSTQKPQPRVSSSQQPSVTKSTQPSRSNPPLKVQSSKDEPQIKAKRSNITLPPLPVEKGPPRPPRVSKTSNVKPSYRKSYQSEDNQPQFNSLQIRKPKLDPPTVSDMPIYATVTKNKSNNDNNPPIQRMDGKPSKSFSQPNLSNNLLIKNRSLSSSSGSSASSSDSESTSDNIESFEPKVLAKSKDLQKTTRASESNKPKIKQPNVTVKSVSETNIPQKLVGVPRHEIPATVTEPEIRKSKKKIFSRPVLNIADDDDDTAPVITSISVGQKKKRPQLMSSSNSESGSLSSKTISTSSSDHSPQPQKKFIPESIKIPTQTSIKMKLKPDSSPKTKEPVKERKSSLSSVNLGGFKKPAPLTGSKSSEQLAGVPDEEDFDMKEPTPTKKPSLRKNSNSKSFDHDRRPTSSFEVNSHSPYIGVPLPPLPTASYPQYHPPEYLEENDPTVNLGINISKPPSEEEIRLRKKEMAEKIRQQTEERTNQQKPVDTKAADLQSNIVPVDSKTNVKPKIKYGRPQFHDQGKKSDSNPGEDDFKMPSPPPPDYPMGGIVVPPSPIVKSKVIGSKEVYKGLYKKDRNPEPASNQDGVEELPFREKMKLFAEKIGEEKVVDRPKFSRKQRKLESGDYS